MISARKNAWGLFVFMEHLSIFTQNSISQRKQTWQRTRHYWIHAGPYLSDKEFRYIMILKNKTAIYFLL